MLNFPVANGTSGHFLGGVLAAVLVGPYAGRSPSPSCSSSRPCCSPTAACRRSASTSSTWRSSGRSAATASSSLLRKLLSVATRRRSRSPPGSPRSPRRCSPRRVRRWSTPRWQRRRVGRLGRRGDGRRPRPDRHRRGIITALAVGSVMAMRPDLVYGARGRLPRPADRRPGPRRQAEVASARRLDAGSWLIGVGPSRPCWSCSSPRTPTPTPTGWRRSPPTRASTARPPTTPSPTARSPTTASRASTTVRRHRIAGIVGVVRDVRRRRWPPVARSPAADPTPPRPARPRPAV